MARGYILEKGRLESFGSYESKIFKVGDLSVAIFYHSPSTRRSDIYSGHLYLFDPNDVCVNRYGDENLTYLYVYKEAYLGYNIKSKVALKRYALKWAKDSIKDVFKSQIKIVARSEHKLNEDRGRLEKIQEVLETLDKGVK